MAGLNIVMGPTRIAKGATGPVVGDTYVVQHTNRVYQAVLQAAPGAHATATVDIEVSENGVNFINLATISLSDTAGEGSATDGFSSSAPWRYTRAKVTGISAGAVDVYLGV